MNGNWMGLFHAGLGVLIQASGMLLLALGGLIGVGLRWAYAVPSAGSASPRTPQDALSSAASPSNERSAGTPTLLRPSEHTGAASGRFLDIEQTAQPNPTPRETARTTFATEGRTGAPLLTALALLLFASLAACAQTDYLRARVYNNHTGQLMEVELHDYAQGKGSVTAALSHGRVLSGEYAIVPAERTQAVQPAGSAKTVSATLLGGQPDSEVDAGRGSESSLPDGYGTTETAGSASSSRSLSIGDRGRVLQIFLEHGSTADANGDGVARDSEGRWYRVQMRGTDN